MKKTNPTPNKKTPLLKSKKLCSKVSFIPMKKKKKKHLILSLEITLSVQVKK